MRSGFGWVSSRSPFTGNEATKGQKTGGQAQPLEALLPGFGLRGVEKARSKRLHRNYLAVLTVLALGGCGKGQSNDESSAPTPAKKLADSSRTPAKSPAEPQSSAPLKKVSDRPANPDGRVFVAEYHQIRSGKNSMYRAASAFLADLNRFYKDGFRPVTMAEYMSGKMPIGQGASPVVFTFDDANPTQFTILPDGKIDPTCAVGIWQKFAETHPDFPIKATFYVLPNLWKQPKLDAAKQSELVRQKLEFLKAHGCEIGNHTVDHIPLRTLPDDKVKEEIGGEQLLFEKLGVPAPTAFAYPDGSTPRNSEIIKGFVYQGHPIKITNAVLVGAEPAPSPTSKKLNPYRIPRIQANAQPSGLDDWLTKFEAGKVKVYVQG